MKKLNLLLSIIIILVASAFTPNETKIITKSGHISIFSHTVAEDITANNYKVISTITPSTGALVFSVPMQGFEFEKALMQKHFNSPKFLDTKQYPKSKFKGTITNMSLINLSKDGKYNVSVIGDLSLHGVTKKIEEKGVITVKEGKIEATSKFKITLSDYNIAFEKGKPSTNIAKDIELNIKIQYNS